jgi:hypothetical protein
MTRHLPIALVVGLASCGPDLPVRQCERSDECLNDGQPGVCTPSPGRQKSFCAFADDACQSGLRWSPLAGDALADTCVAEPEDVDIVDSTPPAVLDVSPKHNATDVGRRAVITATFSEVLDPASVDSESLVVELAGTRLNGTVKHLGGTLTFTPHQPLTPHARFVATVSGLVQDQGGNALTAGFSWSFKTQAGAWSIPVEVGAAQGSSTLRVRAAFAAAGSGIAVWQREPCPPGPCAHGTLYASNYINGTWSTPVQLSAEPVLGVAEPVAAINDSGFAVVVWAVSGARDERNGSYAAIFDPRAGWQPATRISRRETFGGPVVVGADNSATAVWVQPPQRADQHLPVVAARLEPGRGWQEPEVLASFGARVNVAIDANDVVTAVWDSRSYPDAAQNGLYWSRFAGTWAANQRLGSPGGGQAIAMAANGAKTYLLYTQNPAAHDTAVFATAVTDGQWAPPTLLAALPGRDLPVAAELTAWPQGALATVYQSAHQAAYLCDEHDWRAFEGVPRSAESVRFAADEVGRTAALWTDTDRRDLFASFYEPGATWGTPHVVDLDYTAVGDRSIHFDPSRNQWLAVWRQGHQVLFSTFQ